MNKSTSIDYEDLFFFLHENRFIKKYIEQSKGNWNTERNEEDIKRAYYNNENWREKILIKALIDADEKQKKISEKIKWLSYIKNNVKRGLDAWM